MPRSKSSPAVFTISCPGPDRRINTSRKATGRSVVIAQAERSPLLPDVPAFAEVLPGYKRDGSLVMLAPAGTPRPILHQLGKEVGASSSCRT